ncbi:MBL fold metallo-hydrolase [Desulfitobacterium chlororespirans]|uniref:Glyoxylase, beta-lactamase superfamily II n=1 Tax=Desulfitobacterium chlororespirans DSM 11544 TaxID=1121395 RepID=A0A1M7UB32_9FIRM|nr:MBL fold metallo-hydrolase [Desulfitobacterium chlororespirans]SHN80203.1 Glyoxylase, beta-lactamase superfamily II [Desulfitobacterium chlororespirans DSM 11544]
MNNDLGANLEFMEAPHQARPPYSNSLLIDDDIKVLIDCACGDANIELLQEKGIDVIINSHFHIDHIMNNYKFPSAEIWAHEDDAPAIQSLNCYRDYLGFHELGEGKVWEEYARTYDIHPTPIKRKLYDGESLDFGKNRLKVIHTPGHTPGHCCFLINDAQLFSAEIDARLFGPWYGHLCSNIDDFIGSVELCQEIKPAVLITSHNGIIRDNIELRLQKFLDVICEREDKLLKALKKPSTIEELTHLHIFYGPVRTFNEFRRVTEKAAITLHLQRLLKAERVTRSGQWYYVK